MIFLCSFSIFVSFSISLFLSLSLSLSLFGVYWIMVIIEVNWIGNLSSKPGQVC